MIVAAAEPSADEGQGSSGDDGSACLACGSTSSRILVLQGRSDRLSRCDSCGLRRLIDPPVGDELAALYNTGAYDQAGTRAGRLAGALHATNNWFRLRELRGLAPGRLLDVGSGKGHFLAAAREEGWRVTGIEFAEAAIAESQRQYGVDIVAGDFLDARLPGPFDVITMWHVLEHLPDPAAAIDRAHDLLRPDGRLIVSVPNIAGLQARLARDAWIHLDLPRHLFHFTPAALSMLLARHGFTVSRVSHLYPELEFVGYVQSGLNGLGIERDLLYRYVKGDRSIAFGPRVLRTLLAAAALVPSAVAWTALAPALGSGASLQVLARRA